MDSKHVLVKRYVFGTNHDGRNCLHWLDDGSLVYPVGKTVVLQQPNSCTQRFLEAAYQSTAITAITMSANKKFMAIAESGPHPQVQIIDTVTRKRRKVLSVTDLESDRYVALSFSSDGRHLVTQGGAPGWNLHYWNWERSQPLACVSVGQVYAASVQATQSRANATEGGGGLDMAGGSSKPRPDMPLTGVIAYPSASRGTRASSRTPPEVVSSIGVSPLDPLLVTVAGMGFFRFYRYTEGLLQPQPSAGVPREQFESFSTHLWVTEHNIVAATQSGRLFLIQDGRYIGAIAIPQPLTSPKVISQDSTDLMLEGSTAASPIDVVTCIAATYRRHTNQGTPSSGFIAGTNRGNVFIFEGDVMAGEAEDLTDAASREDVSRDATGYSFVCHMEIPDHVDGEMTQQQLQRPAAGLQAIPSLSDSPGHAQATAAATATATATATAAAAAADKAAQAGRDREADTPQPRRLFQLRDHAGSKEDGTSTSTTGSPQTGKEKTVVRRAGQDAGGGTSSRHRHDAVTLTTVEGTSASKSGSDGAGYLAGGDPAQRRVTALSLDQAEECLAVLTASGKLFGLSYEQDWVAREAAFVLSGTSMTTMTVTGLPGGGAGGGGADHRLSLHSDHGDGGETATRGSLAAPLEGQTSTRSSLFRPLFPFTHSGSVNGMDCSVRKPLLITTGSDHSIRVWNTQTGQTLICQYFPQEPGAVAIHPDGLMAIVCFPDKVRVLSVLWSSLRERRTINLRNASDVFFAKGGQLAAIVHNNLVDIMNANTCEIQGQLRGHPQRIKDFQWCSTSPYPTDNRVVTCSSDGMIIDWNMAEMRKQTEHTDKRFQYVAVTSDDRSVWAVASATSATALDVSWKVLLREIDRQSLGTVSSGANGGSAAGGAGQAAGGTGGQGGAGSALGNSVGDYEFTESALTRLLVAPHQRVLVAGAEDGSIKAMTFPLQAGIQEAPIAAHALPVTRMAFTFDESTLFTAAADGSVIMWEVYPEKDKPKATGSNANAVTQQHHDPANRRGMNTTEEVLVTRQEVEEQTIEIESLQQYIEKLKTDMESEDKRRAHEQGTRTRERAEELQQEAVQLAAEYDALQRAKADQEQTFLDAKNEKALDAAQLLEEMETQRQREVDALVDECGALQHRLETTKVVHANELKALRSSLSRARVEDEAHFQDVLSQRIEADRKMRRQLEHSQETNRVTLHQLELDTDSESQAVFQKQRAALQLVRERFLRLKGEGAVMRKNATRLEREIEVRANELQLLDGAKTALQSQLADLTHQVAQLHQDIDERDSITEKKEKVIYGLKKQNQELEKHKYVLDHQIRELKGQIEPKQREIAELNQETKRQNGCLEEQHANNITLRQNTEDLKKDIAEQQHTLQARLRTLQGLETYRSRAERDIGELAHQLQDPVALAAAVKELYDVHVAPRDVEQIAPADPNVKHELQSQLEYLATSVDALRRKLKADQQRHKQEVSAMMSENLSLIREIHALRVEMEHLRARVAADTASKQKQQHQQQQQQQRRAAGGRAMSGGTLARGTSSAGSDRLCSADTRISEGGGSGAVAPADPSRRLDALRASAVEGKRSTRRWGGSISTNGGGGPRPPTPPPEIEINSRELRMLRAYIERLERNLAEQSPSNSGASSGVRLPPVAHPSSMQ